MKFLPESNKRTIFSFILLILFVTATILVYQKNTSPKALPSSLSQAPPSRPQPKLLPYGTKIDTKILESEKFKGLKSVPQVKVSQEELGKTNLFSSEKK